MNLLNKKRIAGPWIIMNLMLTAPGGMEETDPTWRLVSNN